MRLTDFKVLTFDCYGTLIDWETGIVNALRPLLRKAPVGRSRDQVLASFARHETAQEAETPGMIYSELLGRVHRRLAEEWGIAASEAEHQAFGGSVGDWPAFADTAGSLSYLKGFHNLVILSNVDRKSFARSLRRLGVAFDAVYTAEDIGSYKPSLRNFEYMLEHLARLGTSKTDINLPSGADDSGNDWAVLSAKQLKLLNVGGANQTIFGVGVRMRVRRCVLFPILA